MYVTVFVRSKVSIFVWVLAPVSPPVSSGVEIAFFLNVRFLTSFGRLQLRAALSCGFAQFFFWRPPAHFRDHELTGTKKGFSQQQRA